MKTITIVLFQLMALSLLAGQQTVPNPKDTGSVIEYVKRQINTDTVIENAHQTPFYYNPSTTRAKAEQVITLCNQAQSFTESYKARWLRTAADLAAAIRDHNSTYIKEYALKLEEIEKNMSYFNSL